ncbi:unnamed protein product [Alopecurus aequalis]
MAMAQQHGTHIQPQPGNERSVADSAQPKPGTATSGPSNGQIEVTVEINREGSLSGSPTRSAPDSSPESKIKSDFEFLWRLRKYLLLLAVLAVSVTYNAGLSPPGGFQMDHSLHHGAIAGDPLLPVRFFQRYEAFFYCNATAFAASLVLIILLLSRGVASRRVWLRSIQVTMILDLFSLMGAYAAGSCRAIRSSVFILVLVCAVFVYVGVHILVFIRVVPKRLKKWVRDHVLQKLQGMLYQRLSFFHFSHSDGKMNSQDEKKEIEEARKFILMLATFAATITYQAGMSPPGGIWGANDYGYRPGTFVLRRHNLLRFDVFTCCNATSFVASLVTVILLLSTELSTHGISTGALFVCVVVDLLGLIGAYAAGCSRNVGTSVAVVLIMVVVLICVVPLVMLLQYETVTAWIEKKLKPAFNKFLSMLSWRRDISNLKQDTRQQDTLKKPRTYLLFLAILAVSLTYQAGLNPPGGFWTSNATNHLAGDPILQDSYHKRYLAFFYFNATAFAASLVMILMLLSRKMSNRVIKRRALQTAMITDLLALTGAFVAGSCREKTKTICISVVILPVIAYVCLHVLVSGLIIPGWKSIKQAQPKSPQTDNKLKGDNEKEQEPPKSPQTDNKLRTANEKEQAVQKSPRTDSKVRGDEKEKAVPRSPVINSKLRGDNEKEQAPPKLPQTDNKLRVDNEKDQVPPRSPRTDIKLRGDNEKEQAPPKSPQTDNKLRGDNEKEQAQPRSPRIDSKLRGDNEKEQAPPKSVQKENKLSGDDEKEQAQPTSPQSDKKSRDDKDLERRRNLLFVLSILAATVTYQAGLNPPGGVWPDENSNTGKPGNPVLQDSHPKRYEVFYYSNAISFVSSVAVIILLINRESCERGIKSYALRVCLIAGLLGLLIAYSAGSCRKLKPVIYLIVIAAAVLACLAFQVLMLSSTQVALEGPLTWLRTWLQKIFHVETDSERSLESSDEANKENSAPGSASQTHDKKEKKRYKYVMLLAILAASITYQAGLNPPGGFWPDDTSDGYKAGNPLLKDIHSSRYMVFFVFNSISFMSSITVVMLLLSKSVRKKKVPLQALHFIMILDLLALITAYAAGSCRKFRTSIFVFVVVCCVVVYLMIVIILSSGVAKWLKERNGRWVPCWGCPSHVTATDTVPPVQDVQITVISSSPL